MEHLKSKNFNYVIFLGYHGEERKPRYKFGFSSIFGIIHATKVIDEIL